MSNLTNKSSRALGVYGAYGRTINLAPGVSTPVSDKDLEAIQANATAKGWIKARTIVIDGAAPEAPKKESPPEDKAELRHLGGGRYGVFVGDEKLSDEPLSKEDAQAMAEEYGAGN